MRILVTGSGGFVGKYIMQAIPEAVPVSNLRNRMADIESIVDGADVIIHTAAISDTGTCERNPEESYNANVKMPVAIAEAARNAKLIFFSSDQVYNGCEYEGPYSEEITNPVSVYARHKLEMEQRVLDINSDAVMLRPTWMFDKKRGFVANMINATGDVEAPGQYRGVTWVKEAADNILKTLNLPGGAYNFGSENDLPMFSLIENTLKILGKDNPVVIGNARHNLWMKTDKAQQQGIVFSSSMEGIRKCVENKE